MVWLLRVHLSAANNDSTPARARPCAQSGRFPVVRRKNGDGVAVADDGRRSQQGTVAPGSVGFGGRHQ